MIHVNIRTLSWYFFSKFRHQVFKMKWWITVSVLTLSVCLTVCWADLTICERNPIHTTAEKSKGDNGFQISFQELDSKKNEKFKPGQNYTGNMPHFVRSFKYTSQTGYFKFSWSILMIVYYIYISLTNDWDKLQIMSSRFCKGYRKQLYWPPVTSFAGRLKISILIRQVTLTVRANWQSSRMLFFNLFGNTSNWNDNSTVHADPMKRDALNVTCSPCQYELRSYYYWMYL